MGKQTIEELEAQVKQLAAENAALKNALEWLYEAVSMPDSGPVPDKYYSAVTNAAAVMYEVTATESFLVSLRAEGVEMAAQELVTLAERGKADAPMFAKHTYGAALFINSIAAQLRSQSVQVKGVKS